MAAKEVFRFLTGTAKTDDGGYVTLNRGDEIPDNLKEGQLERLRRLGAVGSPEAVEAQVDLASASDAELGEFVADHSAKEIVEAAGEDADLASRVLAAEKAGKDRKTAVEGLEKVIEPPTE